MIPQGIAWILGVVSLVLFHAVGIYARPLVIIVLLVFVAIDVFGLVTGRLKLSPFAFAPVLPALFVRPWPIGLLWGFVVIAGIDLIGTLVTVRRYRGA